MKSARLLLDRIEQAAEIARAHLAGLTRTLARGDPVLGAPTHCLGASFRDVFSTGNSHHCRFDLGNDAIQLGAQERVA